jgi:hypothetical protein
MDFLKSFAPSWMNLNVFAGLGAILLVAALYFAYRWFTGSKSPFSDMGEGCDPQIENACGKDANCHPDETGEKGICFPKEEEAPSENVDSEQNGSSE